MPPKKLLEIRKTQIQYTDKNFFFGDYMKKYGVPYPTEVDNTENRFGITAGRSALNTAVVCDMLNKGYAYEDIMDGNKLKDERIASAKNVSDHYLSDTEEDRQWFCDTYTDGCEKFLEFMDNKIPEVVSKGPTAVFREENIILLNAVAFSKDLSQEMVHFTDLYDKKNGNGAMQNLKDRKEYAVTPFDATNEMLTEMQAYYTCNRKIATKSKRVSVISRYAASLETLKQYNEILKENPGVKVQNINCISVANTDQLMKYYLSGSKSEDTTKGIIMDSNMDQVISDILEGTFESKIGMNIHVNKNEEYSLTLDKAKEYTDKYPAHEIISEEEKAYTAGAKAKTDEIHAVIKSTAEAFAKGGDYAPADPHGAMEMILSEYINIYENKELGSDLRFPEDYAEQLKALNDPANPEKIRNSPAFKNFIANVTPEEFVNLLKDGEPDIGALRQICGKYHNEVTKYNNKLEKEQEKFKAEAKLRKQKLNSIQKTIKEDIKAMKSAAQGMKENAGDKALADSFGARKRIIASLFAHHAIEQAIMKTPDVSIIDSLLAPETMDNAVADMENSPKFDDFIKNKITEEAFVKLSENPNAVKSAFNDFLDSLKPAAPEKTENKIIENKKEIDENILGN